MWQSICSALLPGFVAAAALAGAARDAFILADGVFLNGQGPYRLLVDTGAESSVVSPEVARAAGLTPRYRVWVDTAAGSELAPAHPDVTVAVGGARVEGVEFLSYAVDGFDGILGQSALRRMAYRIDYGSRQALFGYTATPAGEALPLEWIDGRPAVRVWADGRPMRMVLDSGASHMVLFRDIGRRVGSARMRTSFGESAVEMRRIGHVRAGPVTVTDVRAAFRPSTRAEDGLLPAAWFDSVAVSGGWVGVVGVAEWRPVRVGHGVEGEGQMCPFRSWTLR